MSRSSLSLQGFPVDPGLPQLEIASDPELMREVFRRHLRPLTSNPYHIQDCVLSRVRYRRADRCVLQYTLHLVEPGTGREWSQWVAGVLYAADRVRRLGKKLRASAPQQQIPEAFLTFEPVSVIADLKMLVQVFPYDRRLPTLPLLMAAPSPELTSLLLGQFGPGTWHIEAWNIEPVRYRAEVAAVLKYVVQARDTTTGKQAERRFYLKAYRDKAGERTYQVLQALSARADAGGAGFTVGKPIAYLSDLRALLQEEAPGISLEQILRQSQDPGPAVRKAARALAALHLDHVATTHHHRLQDEIAAVERAGRLLHWTCPHLEGRVNAIVGAVVAGLQEVPPGPTHRDLKLDHILLDADCLALVDLDALSEADPVLDAATVLAEFAGMPFRFDLPSEWVRTVALAFTEEYFAHVPAPWFSRLPFHFAGAALKVAVGFFQRQEPYWPEKVATLVEEARNSLAGRVW